MAARAIFFGARDQIRTGDPHVGKEMLGLISLRNSARSGHIGSFRSIVGEGWTAGKNSAVRELLAPRSAQSLVAAVDILARPDVRFQIARSHH
jgi:hypothetical protein